MINWTHPFKLTKIYENRSTRLRDLSGKASNIVNIVKLRKNKVRCKEVENLNNQDSKEPLASHKLINQRDWVLNKGSPKTWNLNKSLEEYLKDWDLNKISKEYPND